MIDVKEATWLSFFNHVKEQSIRLNQDRFYSCTKEIESVNLLNIFDRFHQRNMNRYYWSNYNGDFSLLGIGIAKEIISADGDMQQVQKEWHQFTEEADEHNPYEISGTGVTALGGMAFDPAEKPSEAWKHYAPAKLVVPKFVVSYTQGRYFLIVNGSINSNSDVSRLIEEVHQFEKELKMIPEPSQSAQKVLVKEEVKPDDWKALVQRAVDEIKQDCAKKIVLARETKVKLNKEADIGNMLRRLISTQPNSYVFAFEAGDDCFVGATPERLVQMEGNAFLSACIAGTAPRGETEAADRALAADLLHDKKNLEEHAYVVQMIKGSITPYSNHVEIPEEPVIYPLKNLQHLYTPVKAELKSGQDVFDLIARLHPTPALGGVPREKALAFIREEEFMNRGWYGAPVGWLDSGHHSEFAVAIRSGLIHRDEVTLFAGCGVMRDSDPEMEFEETKVKFMPMLHVLED